MARLFTSPGNLQKRRYTTADGGQRSSGDPQVYSQFGIYYAISPERKLEHPAVLVIAQADREVLLEQDH